MSDELEARVRRHLSTVDDVEVRPVSAVLSAAERIARREQRRRRAVVAGVSVALIASAVVFMSTRVADVDHEARQVPATDPESTPAPGPTTAEQSTPVAEESVAEESVAEESVAEPGAGDHERRADPGSATADPAQPSVWSAVPPDPAGVRVQPHAVWTGAEAIAVYGVDADGRPRGDVSSYVPATRAWRDFPDPPVGELGGAHVEPLVAWTGNEMLMLGGRLDQASGPPVDVALAVEPRTGTWRAVDSPGPVVDATHPWVWTGDELLVWGSAGPMGFDPDADEWRGLAPPPVEARTHAASVWTGVEWIVWGGSHDGRDLADGAAYDPVNDTWRIIAAAPLGARRAPAVWTGAEMLVVSGASGPPTVPTALADGAAYDPIADTWRPIASGFAHPGFVPVWTGSHLVMFAKGGAAVYDPVDDVWVDHCCTDTGGGPGGTPVWTATSVVLVGSQDADHGGSVFVVPADAGPDGTVEVDIDLDRPDITSIRRITLRIPDDAFETPHAGRRTGDGDGDAAGDTEVADGTGGRSEMLYLRSWLAPSCACQLGLAVVEDFDDDAPLYGHLADAPRLDSAVGEWILGEADHPSAPTVAFLRVDGLLLQVSVTSQRGVEALDLAGAPTDERADDPDDPRADELAELLRSLVEAVEFGA